MKIIIDTRWIRTLKIDGVANFTLNITRELLNRRGEDQYLLLIHSVEVADYLKQNLSNNSEELFYDMGCPVTSLKNIFKIPRVIGDFKPDIFLSPFIPFYSPLIKGCYHTGVIHDLIPVIFPQMFKNASKKFRLFYCNKFIQKQILKTVNPVITVSESTKNDLINYLGINQQKIKVIVEGAAFSDTQNIMLNLQKEYNINGDYFLFIGRHEFYKNINGLLKVYNKLPEFIKAKYQLVIVGKYNPDITPGLFKLTEDLKESTKVIFIDSLLPEKLIQLYKNAFLMLHLSLYEGFGLTVLEAMSFGLPVIVSNRSSMPEVAGDAAILVNPEDHQQIIEKIINLSEDQDLYRSLSNKGIERAKMFGWQKSAEQLYSIFEKLYRKAK